ncbi:MAG TPA: alpha/beta fold hydrolase, partial [Polyangiaceae bacterium LLY-WYZ-15_(1-7)]|nr:alpha/beta fold hydrolase [Polyangiaceae bacterium LLY-WYZ-15_(1-7)]
MADPNEETITFPGADGHQLAAVLERPPGPIRACAVFAHCFTCSKDLRALRRIADALVGHGIATLRFDFTGLGESEGEFADTTFSSNVADLVAAADWLREHHAAPSLLIGHSLGGAACLAAAPRIEEVKAVATIGAPADPEHVEKLLAGSKDEIEKEGEAEVKIAGRRFRIRKQFLDDLREHCSAERIAKIGRALLLFHSPQDNVVGIENAKAIYQAARHPKSFVSLDGADHLLSNPADAGYVANVLAAWAERYVPMATAEVEEGYVVVEGRQGLQQHVQAGPHAFLADEPKSVGGTATGPTPYDLLLAALGSCTTMTLRMYANHKKWPLEAVRVTLQHERRHAEDCDDCEKTGKKIDVLTRRIEI